MTRARSLRSDVRGATAVEFALLVLPLFLLVLGTFEFGRAMWTRSALQSLAEDGARCMGVLEKGCATAGAYNASNTMTFIRTEADKLSVALPTSAVTLKPTATCAGVTGFSQVDIVYTFKPVVPLVMTKYKNGIPLEASACFPNQPQS